MEHLKHLNLDDAWRNEPFALPVIEALGWGPQLRFSAPPRLIERFYREYEANLAAPFLLYGSGDFHYLTALRLRRVAWASRAGFVRQSSRLGCAPSQMGLRGLGQSRAGTSANQACGSLGLR